MIFNPNKPEHFTGAIALESLVHSRLGKAVRHLLLMLLLLLLCAATYLFVAGQQSIGPVQSNDILGTLLLGSGLYLLLRLFSFYFNYLYFHGLDSQLLETFITTGFVYETAALWHHDEYDLTKALLKSDFGIELLLRLGIAPTDTTAWLAGERGKISGESLTLSAEHQITLKVVAEAIFAKDEALQSYLQSQGITAEMYASAVAWVYHDHLKYKRHEHWWSRDQLSRTRGIGSDFAFGHTYHLSQYTAPLLMSSIYSRRIGALPLRPGYIKQVETVLARGSGSNALLVGEAGVGKLDLLVALEQQMESGKALASISAKHFVLVSGDRLVADFGREKAELEQALQRILFEAEAAGNVILIFKNLPSLMKSVNAVGVEFASIIEPFLASATLQIVATAEPADFHSAIEHEGALLRQFELIQIAPTEKAETITLIQELAQTYEGKRSLIFTIQAVQAIITDAHRFVVHGVMPDKAIQLLDELATTLRGPKIVSADDVHAFVNKKTGAPVGPLSEDERSKLLNLEEVLQKRVIGQDAAIAAIAGVMQRSRANITASDKPLGTLLFLGPTGVGKTETAKALAHTFFGSEEKMTRFDMSEYANPHDMDRLLGGNGQEGTLATALREEPYCVLLLDEFEKADEAVHNLFLQILDEGRFSDGYGESVNARNTIIIATSNAGSDQIRSWVSAGTPLQSKKSVLIDELISSKAYRPELLNRFDEVVLYAPLSRTEQSQIAVLLLRDLKDRLKEQGHQLQITTDLIETVVELGYEPAFGARPMRRVIQSVIEKKIAQKILAGTIVPGEPITLSKQELEN